MRFPNTIRHLVLPLISMLLVSGCIVKTVDVLPGVPLRITHPTVTIDPDVRQNGAWIPTHGSVTIQPGELVAVPLPPRPVAGAK